MEINDILETTAEVVDQVVSLDDLKMLEEKFKTLVKEKKAKFAAAEKLATKAEKDGAKVAIRSQLTEKDVGGYVVYTYGSGKDKTTRVGKVVRAPTAEKPSFSVEADDGKGGVKRLPRNASAFVRIATDEDKEAAGITVTAPVAASA